MKLALTVQWPQKYLHCQSINPISQYLEPFVRLFCLTRASREIHARHSMIVARVAFHSHENNSGERAEALHMEMKLLPLPIPLSHCHASNYDSETLHTVVVHPYRCIRAPDGDERYSAPDEGRTIWPCGLGQETDLASHTTLRAL